MSVECKWEVLSVSSDRDGSYVTARNPPTDTVQVFCIAHTVGGCEFLKEMKAGDIFISTLTRNGK